MRLAFTILVLSFPLLITAGAMMSHPELPHGMTVDANTTTGTQGQQGIAEARSTGTASRHTSSEERSLAAEKNHIR